MLRKNKLFILVGAVSLAVTASFAQTVTVAEKYATGKFKIPANVSLDEFMPKTIIAKVRPDLKNALCSGASINHSEFAHLFANVGGYNLVKKFPHTKAPHKKYNEQGIELVDLTLVYEFKYTANLSLEKAINKFIALGIFQYVEPHFIPHTFLTPNDPSYGTQWHLPKIKADLAWNVNTGSSSVVIGITDTGIEYNHPDLQTNLKTSTTDPVGGGDQDGDGYVDNWRGWDLGENDNDATWQGSDHGVHVTGIAAATTNNSTGVSGVGYNCKYLPVKIADATGKLVASYEGITYAADHGCHIINCSWGGAYGGQAGQDVITYASINKNCLVVVSAGNNGTQDDSYPASFQYALSVANTKSNDGLLTGSSGSQYGYNIDVCAPGTNIYATVPAPSYYGYKTGTSMAAPCVAGAAGIVKSMYPTYTGLQVGERLKTTCDNINAANPSFVGKIGDGRINLQNAVTAALKPSVCMTSRTETDGNDNAFVPGDTIQIRGVFTNYLAPTTNLTATASITVGAYATVTDATTSLGAIPTLGTANNNNDPFKIYIKPAALLNLPIDVKITYTDGTYSKVEWFKITVNVDYINVAVNDVSTSITSNGRLGYRADGQTGGLGFTYMGGQSILYEAALMIAKDTSVSDAFRGISVGGNNDFSTIKRAAKVIPTVKSDFDVDVAIKDNLALKPLPVDVHHTAYAWTTNGFRKFVIVQYVIKNTGSSSLNGVYAGIAADWDIDKVTFKDNRAAFDAANKMGYVYHTGTNGIYAGIKLLTSSAPVVHYAMDNVAGGAGGVDASDGFDGPEKFTTLSTNRAAAGTAGTGEDVIHVVSTGPYNIAAGDSIKVAFALLAGDNLTDLQTSASNSQIKYDGLSLDVAQIPTEFGGVKVYPNPTNANSNIEIKLDEAAMVELSLYNVLGEKLGMITSEKLQSGTHLFNYDTNNLSSGIYYYQLTVNNKAQTIKMIVTK